MPSITEQFSAVTKSQLEAQFNIFNTFAHTAVDSVEKLVALHLSTTKSSVEKSSAAAKQLLEAKDAKAFFSAQQQAPASFDSVLAYGRELYAIASGAQAELIKSTRGAALAVQAPVPVLAAPVAVAKAPAPVAAPVSAPAVAPVIAPVAAPVVAAAPVAAVAPAPVAPPASIPAAVSAAVQAAVKAVEAPAPQAAAVAAQPKPAAATVAPTAPEKIQAAAVKPGAVELENKPPKLKTVPPKAKQKK